MNSQATTAVPGLDRAVQTGQEGEIHTPVRPVINVYTRGWLLWNAILNHWR